MKQGKPHRSQGHCERYEDGDEGSCDTEGESKAATNPTPTTEHMFAIDARSACLSSAAKASKATL